jgi:predicted RNA-binding protein with PIN domain
VHYLVDGMNVVGSRPDGWWRDRPAARRALVAQLASLAADHDIVVVFDGRAAPGEVEQAATEHVDVRFAPGGPNAADDVIVATVELAADPESICVVSSDSALVGRVTALGARVQGASSFRRLLEA